MFEILFKYPAGMYQKGHFVLLTPWPLWLMGLAILAAAGLLFWHVRRNHGMLSGMRPIAVWLLETAMVALLLFLLWHPALSVATLKPRERGGGAGGGFALHVHRGCLGHTRSRRAGHPRPRAAEIALGPFPGAPLQVRQGARAHTEADQLGAGLRRPRASGIPWSACSPNRLPCRWAPWSC